MSNGLPRVPDWYAVMLSAGTTTMLPFELRGVQPAQELVNDVGPRVLVAVDRCVQPQRRPRLAAHDQHHRDFHRLAMRHPRPP